MNRREFNAALRIADAVFVWTIVSDGVGVYVEVTKAALRRALPDSRGDTDVYNAILRDDGDLYIN